MKIPGRLCLLVFIILLTTGTSLARIDPLDDEPAPKPPVAETTTEPEVGQARNTPIGIRAGYTSWDGINQFHFGGHIYLGELWPNVEFTPNLEIGIGDSATTVTINGDVAYLFTEFFGFPWGLYGGGSLSFIYFNPDPGGSNTDLGLSGLVGTTYTMANDHKAMAEIRFGIMDSPSFKLTFGYTLF